MEWNARYNSKGLEFRKLKNRKKLPLVLAYRKDKMESLLKDMASKNFLESLGYDLESLSTSLLSLEARLVQEDFPHEIGLFLGYKYEDVMGFVSNKGKNYLSKGYWKVYYGKEEKDKLFQSYKKIQRTYQRLYQRGYSLDDLIISTYGVS